MLESFLPKTFLRQAKINKSSVKTWKCAWASALCVPPGGLATLRDACGLWLQAQLLFTDGLLSSASCRLSHLPSAGRTPKVHVWTVHPTPPSGSLRM